MNKNKQKWISEKIKKLVGEGMPQNQAVAVAYNMHKRMLEGGTYDTKPKYQEAGYVNNSWYPNPYFSENPNMVWNANLEQYMTPPNSKNQSERMVPFDSTMEQETQSFFDAQADPNLNNIEFINNTRPQQSTVNELTSKGLTPFTIDIDKELKASSQPSLNEFQNQYRRPQQNQNNTIMFNPYGNIGLEQSLAYAGQGFGSGQTGKGLMGSTLAGLKGARTFLSGFAIGKEENRLQDEYRNNMTEEPRYLRDYQEGGSIPYTERELKRFNQGMGVQFTNEGAQWVNPKSAPLNVPPLDLGRYNEVDYFNVKQQGESYIVQPSKNNYKGVEEYSKDLMYLQKLNPNVEILGVEDSRYFVPQEQRMQKGGEVTNSEVLTDEYLVEAPSQQKNVELEDGEHIENSQTGDVKEVVGEKHDKGGVETELPNGSKVISDYTKIGKKNAKKFKEELDVKVRATDTFATVLDKVNKNIGLDKLIEEEKSIYEKVEEQEKDNDLKDNIKKLNLTALQKKLENIAETKETLKVQQKEAFDKIFEEQEKIPKKNKKGEMEKGRRMNEDLEFLSKKYKLDKNKLMDLMQEGGYTNRQRLKDWLAEAKGLGFKEEIDLDSDNIGEEVGKLQKFYAENFPEDVLKYFQDQPINAKGVAQLKKQNPELFEKAGIPKTKKPADYTNEERLKLQNVFREENPDDKEFWLDQFQDNVWNENNIDTWRAIRVPSNKQIQPTGFNTTIEAQIPPTGQSQQETVGTNQSIDSQQLDVQMEDKGVSPIDIPLIPQDFILPPSARQPVYKQSVEMGRIDPVKVSAEPNIVELERQRQALDEATRFLPPAQRASVMANALGQTQSATNQAISQTEATNAQAQYNADLYNLQAQAKEDLLNTRFNQDYEAKTMAALGNQEMDIRRYFNDLNNQQRFNYDYIERRNLLNQAYPNYNVKGSSNIDFVGGQDFNQLSQFFTNNSVNGKSIEEMSVEEYRAEMQKQMAKMKNNYQNNR